MFYTSNNLISFDGTPDPQDAGAQIQVSPMLNGSKSILFQLAFKDAEHKLNGVQVRRVSWSEDVLKAEFIHSFNDFTTMMDSQIVHYDADIVVEMTGSQLLEPDFELWDVYRLLEDHC